MADNKEIIKCPACGEDMVNVLGRIAANPRCHLNYCTDSLFQTQTSSRSLTHCLRLTY